MLNSRVSETVKYKSVSFQDVFQLSKLHVKYRHKTLFGDPKWVFTVDKNALFQNGLMQIFNCLNGI